MGSVVSPISPWASNGTITSPEARLALAASWAKSPTSSILTEGGVVEGANPGASVAGNSVLVTAHQAVVEAAGGTYVGTSVATLAVPLDTPLPAAGSSRYDIVYAEIVDSSDSATYRLNTVKGTASAVPSVPTAPLNTVPLFRVLVTNTGPQAPVAVYGYTRAPGAARLVEPGDSRAGSYIGDQRKFRSGQMDVWTGAAWLTLVAPTTWQQANVNFSFAGAGALPAGTVDPGSGGASTVRFKLAGNDLTVHYELKCGAGAGGGAGTITTVLPGGRVAGPRTAWLPCHLYVPPNAGYGSVAMDVSGMAIFFPNSNQVTPFFPLPSSSSFTPDIREAPLRNTDESLVVGHGVPLVPNAFPLIEGSILTIGPGQIEVA